MSPLIGHDAAIIILMLAALVGIDAAISRAIVRLHVWRERRARRAR
jgi:hypothetical protein